MRSAPASRFRTGRKRHPTRNSIPSEGSRLRSLYDLFHSSKGRVIEFAASAGNGRPMSDLIEYYGLDIRRVDRCKWVLAGEWFGSTYQDYISEHLTSLEKQGAA
jgi:hypothetical protein